MSRVKVTKEALIELYVNDPHASMQDVADKLGCHRSTVFNKIKQYGLSSKSPGPQPEVEVPELSDVQWLTEQLQEKTFNQLANELGTSVGRIADRAYRYGIKSPSTDKSDSIRKSLQKRYPNGRFGEEASNWKGGRKLANNSGYIHVYAPDHPQATKQGYVMEHRLEMEEMLGRYLESGEVVHHKNGIKDDNRPENLEVLTRSEHVTKHFDALAGLHEAEDRIAELEEENRMLREKLAQYES